MEKIKIILIDDHQIVRDGIKALISGAKEFEVVAEAGECESILLNFESGYFSSSVENKYVVIMDISLPGISGIEATRILKLCYPDLKVLILSMYTNEDYIQKALTAGADGYLPKNTTRKELIDAIKQIYSGSKYFNEEISHVILESYINNVKKNTSPKIENTEPLSQREKEILKLFVQGHSNPEIAEKLYISVRTVESHKNHIMQKLHIKSSVEMVKYAIKNGLADF
ncbi:MAG: response regulator transcription factor [Bacteroidota bacterium]|nr:response regulator transcription factor [Bacteroidota bacterium]